LVSIEHVEVVFIMSSVVAESEASAVTVTPPPNVSLELELVERDLMIFDAHFARFAFEQQCLNDWLCNKTFPEHITHSVLTQFRTFADARHVLEKKRDELLSRSKQQEGQ
jgi:hypothetical protein